MTFTGILRACLLFGFIPICLVTPVAAQDRRVPVPRVGYEQVQVVPLQEDTAIFGWARPVAGGHDLLVARRGRDGAMGEARRLQGRPGSVRILDLDEARPALVSDGHSLVGAAWFDRQGRLWAARSSDGGRAFGAAMRIDDGPGHAAHAFVHAAFDDHGDLHVVWLDAREAPDDLEEPAHLYHATLTSDGATAETDLSSAFFDSVCGCCRPFVHVDRFGLKIDFRAIDERGYRDVHRRVRRPNGDWAPPVRIGPPLWKIAACPMSGPVGDTGAVIWRDGSQPVDRIVEGWPEGSTVRAILRPDDRTRAMRSPRWVGGTDRGVLLVPGDPAGWLLQREGAGWTVLTDEAPSWCTDALRIRDQILLVGDEHGRLQLEAYDPYR